MPEIEVGHLFPPEYKDIDDLLLESLLCSDWEESNRIENKAIDSFVIKHSISRAQAVVAIEALKRDLCNWDIIERIANQGNRVKAIKLIRGWKNCTLKEAKVKLEKLVGK